jgi:flavin reductase (DIM6/NTAB) family NADH-FMN oxidoreductase RutF
MGKCDFPVDKKQWCPSLLPGPIVLISTISADGVPNVAPKSWVQMVSFEPSVLMFSGTRGNPTENNIEATGCFGVNIVNEAMLASVLRCLQWHGPERIQKSGWHLEPASKIAAPLVVESPAHLECTLEDTYAVGSGYVVFGRIVSGGIDRAIAEAPPEERYRLLGQTCFLEDGVYSVIREKLRM